MIHRWCGCDSLRGVEVVAPRFFYLLNHSVSYSVTIFIYESHGM